MTFGEKIKEMRESLRYSQQEFAGLLGISQTIVSQYELGRKNPSLPVLRKIVKFAKTNKYKIKLLEE
ncbi:helix-turn-helix domain-containing protein [Candidatus Parcubacteria bacterium]|nr:helix-turn-helix domain-containing protein [Candidatus Parcubacteria bacterium]